MSIILMTMEKARTKRPSPINEIRTISIGSLPIGMSIFRQVKEAEYPRGGVAAHAAQRGAEAYAEMAEKRHPYESKPCVLRITYLGLFLTSW